MNIESKLWKLIALNAAQIMIVQKASGASRIVSASALPDVQSLAMMHERAFDTAARDAFHK
jgi:hypothetical protein